MHALHWIDYVIIVIYMAVTLFIGLIMTRKASASLDHYFLGGRSMPWWLLGIAGMTNWFDLTGTMIITSFLYMLGPRGLYVEFRGGAVLVLAFLLCYAGKWHRRSGCMTGAEWTIYRFGSGLDAQIVRTIGALSGLAMTVGMLAYLVKGTNLFMGIFFPWPPIYSTLAVIILTTAYTMCAGFYGMVLTDLVQGVIIMVSCVLVGMIAWSMIPDSASLTAIATRVTGNAAWIHSSLPKHTPMPRGYEDYQWLFLFAMFYLLRNVLSGMGCGAEARYFGAKSDRDCGLQSLLQGVTVMFRWPMMIGFAVMGIFLVNQLYPDMGVIERAATRIQKDYPQVSEADWHDLTLDITTHPERHPAALIQDLKSVLGEKEWSERMPLISYRGTINPERILPAVLLEKTPTGLKGFILVAMLAALMSTFTGTVNGAGAFFVRDIWQNLIRPRAGNRELIAVSWLTSLALVVAGVVMGISTESINKIWGWIIMGLGAGGLAPALLRLYWWRLNAWGCLGGTVFGLVGSLIQYFALPDMLQYQKMTPEAQVWMTQHLPAWLVRLLHMPAEWQMFICFSLISFAGAIFFSLVTRPTEEARLVHFFRTTRPFGWWGPIRKKIEPGLLKDIEVENRQDILAVPFAMLAQVTLFLLPMQLVIKSYDSFLQTLPLFLVGAAGLWWFWWRNLPPAETPSPADEASLRQPELAASAGRQGD